MRTRRALARLRAGAALAAALLVLPAVSLPAQAGSAPRTGTPEQDRLAQAERQALAELAESSEQVRAAAVALSGVAAQLPGAEADVAKATGGLAGARAGLTAATAELAEAELAEAAAATQVEAAGERVEQGRRDVGVLVRRTYQRGQLGDLREVVESADPQDVLRRATMLRSVFDHQYATLDRLTADRLALAGRRAGLAAERRAVALARATAQEREQRARTIAEQAEQAQARVQSLLATRAAALQSAERARAADTAEYAQAQAASRALAERIREAERRAAAEQARRQAAEAAAARAAAERAAAERAAAQAAAATAAQRRQAARQAAADAARRASRQWRPAPSRAATDVARGADDVASLAGGAGWLWPCGGCPQTSSFGWRTHPIFGDRRLHAGIDMGAPIGHAVRAAASGTVLIAGSASGYGTLVVVGHGGGLSTAYAHMSTIAVRAGQAVGRGEQLGEVGDEGGSTGPHLHFEVRRDGEPVDPSAYVGGS